MEANKPGFLVVRPGAFLPTFPSSVAADCQGEKEGRRIEGRYGKRWEKGGKEGGKRGRGGHKGRREGGQTNLAFL